MHPNDDFSLFWAKSACYRKKILTILPIADGKMASFCKTSFLWGNLFVLILPANM